MVETTTTTVIEVARVVEPEECAQVDEVVTEDNLREERLERIRMRQLEWAT